MTYRSAARAHNSRAARLRSLSADQWTEDDLQWSIINHCDGLDADLVERYPGMPGMRLRCHHETDSRRSRAGFPDLWIAGPGGLGVSELKRQAVSAKPTAEQSVWLDVLMLAGVAAFLWRPADWLDGAIEGELVRIATPTAQALEVARLERPKRRRCGCLPGAEHSCFIFGGQR